MVQLFVLSLACMFGGILSTTTQLPREQFESPQLFSEKCCSRKEVGGVGYTQVAGETDDYPDCVKDCVYERDLDPGSRICFQSGGLDAKPAKCTEPTLDSKYINVTRTSEKIIFKTDDGTFSCPVGSGTSESENITCSQATGQEEGLLTGNEEAAFLSSKSPDGTSQWMSIHTESESLHYDFNEPLTYQLSPPYETNKLYVEGAENITGNLEEQRKECLRRCRIINPFEATQPPYCWFWTLSYHDDDTPSNGRKHRGVSECGLRTYLPFVKLETDPDQYIGFWNDERVPPGDNGFVYVWRIYAHQSANSCNNLCGDISGCRTWTWELATGKCTLNYFNPTRLIDISFGNPKPRLMSGCFSDGQFTCPTI